MAAGRGSCTTRGNDPSERPLGARTAFGPLRASTSVSRRVTGRASVLAMGRPDIRELAERLLRDPRRDGLGVGADVEAQLAVIDAVAARFFRAPSEEGLKDWQALLDDASQPVDDESRARLAAHRALLQAVSSHGLDEPDAQGSWASSLGRNVGSGSHVEDLIRGLGAMLMSVLASSAGRPIHEG